MPEAAAPWIRRATKDGAGTVTSSVVEIVDLVLRGEEEAAATLATEALRNRPNRFGAHEMLSDSLLIIASQSLIEADRAEEAVALLERKEAEPREFQGMPLDAQDQDAMLGFHDIPRRWTLTLASAYRATGRPEKAREIIGHSTFTRLATIEEYRDAPLSVDYLIEAEARMIEGDSSGALDMLEAAVDANLYFNWQIRVEKNAAFAELQSDARFTALLDRIRDKINVERLAVTGPQQVTS